VQIWGDGSQRRSFVYVTDLVRATLRMVETNKYHTMNVGTAESVSIRELASLLAELLGQPARVVLDRNRPPGPMQRILETSRMDEIAGFTPRPLRSGLRDTVEWYRSVCRGATAT
jgi:nucleoside-diphosphate-sugar epimerase